MKLSNLYINLFSLIFLIVFASCEYNMTEPIFPNELSSPSIVKTDQFLRINTCEDMSWVEATNELNNYQDKYCENIITSRKILYFYEPIWISDFEDDCFNVQMLYFQAIVFATNNAPQGYVLSPYNVNKINFIADVIPGIPGGYAITIENIEYVTLIGIIKDGENPCSPSNPSLLF
jgi:hypothetical protein